MSGFRILGGKITDEGNGWSDPQLGLFSSFVVPVTRSQSLVGGSELASWPVRP